MTAPPKTCVICGADCSNRPRIKDQSGRYACRACNDAARDRAEDAAAIDALLGPPPEARKGVRNLFRGGREKGTDPF